MKVCIFSDFFGGATLISFPSCLLHAAHALLGHHCSVLCRARLVVSPSQGCDKGSLSVGNFHEARGGLVLGT